MGMAPIIRFFYYYAIGQGNGHVQSLIIGGALVTLGVIATMFGAVADLVGRNRQLLEQTLERLHRIEDTIRSGAAEDIPFKNESDERRDGTDG